MNKQKLAFSILTLIIVGSILGTESFAEEKLDLRLRLKPGQKYNMQITEEKKVSQTMMGQQRNINHNKTTGLEYEVKKVDIDGITLLEITYRNLKEKTDSTTGQFEYDSTNPCTEAGNPLAPMYAALMGQSFTIKVSPKGQIIKITGLDEMYSRTAEKMVKAEDEMISKAPITACEKKEGINSTAQDKESAEDRAKRRIDNLNKQYGSREKRIEATKKMIKNQPIFAEQKLMELVGNTIMPFAAEPVAVGDSWQSKILSSSIPVEVNGTYTLKAANKGIVSLDVNSKIQVDKKGVQDNHGPPGIQITGTGSCQGDLQIDHASGWLIRKKAIVKFSGEMKMAQSQEMSQAITIPMSIETRTVVEQIK